MVLIEVLVIPEEPRGKASYYLQNNLLAKQPTEKQPDDGYVS